ncbi:MAG: argininosuccinate lyase [Spirochaetales bacterium]|nr:argininosuccinate lyase [Spirochaetales bacterium]
MAKMWAGRTAGDVNELADSFNSSISFDSRLYKQDITGSMAHAAMLSAQGIISSDDADSIISALKQILQDIESGNLQIDPKAEDIHMFVEQVLTERIGDTGKKLHTARSRNDQVALDLRLYLRDYADEVSSLLKDLVKALKTQAEKNIDVIMPGYTHLQHAQPVLFSHYMLAYAMMFLRDIERIKDCRKRINVSPIGCCALAGTTYDTDRALEAKKLGFDSVCLNSLDGVSDRDFCVELLSSLSLVMTHLSRLSEELILWSSQEFSFIELSDDFTTGSSIMPQKKNPDMAELCRGKTGRVYGDLMGLLTTLKGLPLAYNKDMQEDKEGVFDACDTVKMCLSVCAPMILSMKINKENMLESAKKGFMNATDLADYLVIKGLPFRDAYKISGSVVAYCIQTGHILEDLPLSEYKKFSTLISDDVYQAIDLANCVQKRSSEGGTSTESVKKQLAFLEDAL